MTLISYAYKRKGKPESSFHNEVTSMSPILWLLDVKKHNDGEYTLINSWEISEDLIDIKELVDKIN
jgi:hypothetical protein